MKLMKLQARFSILHKPSPMIRDHIFIGVLSPPHYPLNTKDQTIIGFKKLL
jgi:hypothetical protein